MIDREGLGSIKGFWFLYLWIGKPKMDAPYNLHLEMDMENVTI
jgi:hypothetical protein